MPRDLSTLGARLKHAREKRALNQSQLAAKAGLKQADISKLETGRMQKTTGMARLAAALQVSAAWLELGDGSPPDWEGDAPGQDFDGEQLFVVTASDLELLEAVKVLRNERQRGEMIQEARELILRAREASTHPQREQYLGFAGAKKRSQG